MFTMHATTMIFLVVMPLGAAFFNFIMPLQIGARDVAFPRLNAFSFWVFLVGAIILNLGWFMKDGAPDAGWFGYAPADDPTFSPTHAIDMWVMGLQLLGVASIAAALNFIVTIINLRAPGMTMMRLPVFTWMTLFTSFLIILSFPAITIALVELMMDRLFGTNFFEVSNGGMPILWQHLFWIFGHPEVYILILPGHGHHLGDPAHLLAQAALRLPDRRLLRRLHRFPRVRRLEPPHVHDRHGHDGDRRLRAHDDGDRGPDRRQDLQLDRHPLGRPPEMRTPMMFALGFIWMFMIGGLSGIMHAAAPADAQQHNSYFVVAHFHYVLIGGSLFALFAGIHYWFPLMFGRKVSEFWGKLSFWLIFIGFNVTFFPMHFLGLEGMPRRTFTYDGNMGWNRATCGPPSAPSSSASGSRSTSHMVYTYYKGERTHKDPWDARTLEWSLPNPPPEYNFQADPDRPRPRRLVVREAPQGGDREGERRARQGRATRTAGSTCLSSRSIPSSPAAAS
jgi:cytochrome c oxidase subunit 1